VLIDEHGYCRLSDFGLAGGGFLDPDRYSRTQCGTIPYMSPEALQGGEYRCETDVFSLGVMLFELYSGELPWSYGTINANETDADILAEYEQAKAKAKAGNVDDDDNDDHDHDDINDDDDDDDDEEKKDSDDPHGLLYGRNDSLQVRTLKRRIVRGHYSFDPIDGWHNWRSELALLIRSMMAPASERITVEQAMAHSLYNNYDWEALSSKTLPPPRTLMPHDFPFALWLAFEDQERIDKLGSGDVELAALTDEQQSSFADWDWTRLEMFEPPPAPDSPRGDATSSSPNEVVFDQGTAASSSTSAPSLSVASPSSSKSIFNLFSACMPIPSPSSSASNVGSRDSGRLSEGRPPRRRASVVAVVDPSDDEQEQESRDDDGIEEHDSDDDDVDLDSEHDSAE
jgi:serine/threonine protein kinase